MRIHLVSLLQNYHATFFAKTLLAQDPIQANAATQGHMCQSPAAATEFIEFT